MTMDPGLGWLVAAVAVVALVVSVAGISSRRSRLRLERDLAASRQDLAEVRRRLDGLSRSLVAPTTARTQPQEFVITTAGRPDPATVTRTDPTVTSAPIDTRAFASVALGESLVTVLSLGHGLRRALSAENRNRIGFEIRREVRRSRRQRKRELKEAKRHLRAQSLHEDAA